MEEVKFVDAALFLDFDGTLVRLEPTPDAVSVSPAVKDIVAEFGDVLGGAIAIVSGREAADLQRMLRPLRVRLAGAHGAQLVDPQGGVSAAAERPYQLDEAFGIISAYAQRHGLLQERKATGMALHFRSRPELEHEARSFVGDLGSAHPQFRVLQGKMVSELTLKDVNKGRAIEAFMASSPFAGRIPIAAGDDTTDEDSFAAVRAMGGIGIKTGPGATAAGYRLAGVDACLAWLRACLDQGSFRFDGVAQCV